MLISYMICDYDIDITNIKATIVEEHILDRTYRTYIYNGMSYHVQSVSFYRSTCH